MLIHLSVSSQQPRDQNNQPRMQAVSFVNGKPVFQRYLDTFPFPHYVVVKDIAALPRTLADLLRQWFELSSG